MLEHADSFPSTFPQGLKRLPRTLGCTCCNDGTFWSRSPGLSMSNLRDLKPTPPALVACQTEFGAEAGLPLPLRSATPRGCSEPRAKAQLTPSACAPLSLPRAPGSAGTSRRCSESPGTCARPLPAPPRAAPSSRPVPALGPGGRRAARSCGPALSWLQGPGFQTEALPPVARVLAAAGQVPPPPSPAGALVRPQRVPGRHAGAGLTP